MNNSNDLSLSLLNLKTLQKQIQFLRDEGLLRNREWIEYAACRGCDTAVFFPPGMGDNSSNRHTTALIYTQRKLAQRALEICKTCPVIRECKNDHEHESGGVFYGTVPAERTRNTRRRPCRCLACNQPTGRRVLRYNSHVFYD